MRQFEDMNGRTWTLRLDAGAYGRVWEELKLDLEALADGAPWVALAEDPAKAVTVVYAIVRPQVEAAGLSPGEFARAIVLDPKVYERAVDALIAARLDAMTRERRAEIQQRMQQADESAGK